MLIGKNYRIDGKLIKDNEQYVLLDNRFLKNIVVSETRLRKRQSTNGHAHQDVEEVYIITNGSGSMLVGKKLIPVEAGDVVSIASGEFHQVVSSTNSELHFIAIFQSYERPKQIDQYEKDPLA